MRNMLKRILGVTLAMILSVSSMIVTVPINAYAAEEPQLPSVTKFATPADLCDADNFTLHTDNGTGVAQKVNFGDSKIWYIAGKDKDGSLVLMCDCDPNNAFPSLPFNSTYNSSYGSPDVYDNHYGYSEIREYLTNSALEKFSEQEMNLMINKTIYTNDTKNGDTYSTSDKLYLAYGDINDDKYITVGANSPSDLNNGIKVGLIDQYGPNGSPYINVNNEIFWLRAPFVDSGSCALFAWAGSSVSRGFTITVDEYYYVVPAFNLDLSRVLFSSTAPAAQSGSSIDNDDAMILRIKNNGQFTSTAKVTGQKISVTLGDNDEDVFLYVQGKNGGTDWVKSVKINETKEYTLSDLDKSDADLSKCQVWLEKKVDTDNLVYAEYAQGGNHKGGSGNGGSGNGGSGNDDSSNGDSDDYYCDHDFVLQTITAPTTTSYGTEGEVCSKCGATRNVREKSPLDGFVRMQINNAKPGDVLTLNFGPWNSFPLWMMQMIADKPTVTYILIYTYRGNKYEVTIKPGDKFALDCEWYGPLKTANMFDTVITKL